MVLLFFNLTLVVFYANFLVYVVGIFLFISISRMFHNVNGFISDTHKNLQHLFIASGSCKIRHLRKHKYTFSDWHPHFTQLIVVIVKTSQLKYVLVVHFILRWKTISISQTVTLPAAERKVVIYLSQINCLPKKLITDSCSQLPAHFCSISFYLQEKKQ